MGAIAAPSVTEHLPTTKHQDFYLLSGDVVIQVEQTLFRLDLAMLHAHSPVLKIIMPPIYDGHTRLQGFNDDSPFRLPGVSALEFDRLLRVLCPLPSTSPDYPPLTVSEEWLSMLKLACQYEIASVKPTAAKYLSLLPLDPVRKIAIWETYKLDSAMLLPAYIHLCMRIKR